MKAIQVSSPGGPEQLQLADVPVPAPGPGQVLIKIAFIGVNYIDTYFRTGLYKADPPISLGMEASGTVEAVGPDVRGLAPGDRVAYCLTRGSYAEYAVAPAWQVVKVPEGVELEAAAAALLQGMTAHYLTHDTYVLKRGDTALVHAAAGGVGLLLVQVARMRGARVLATVGSARKAELARKAGADEVILYGEKDFAAEVRDLTSGRGVQVVYDSVGQATFRKSLECLAPRGMLVCFGQSSGTVPPFELSALSPGSLFLTRPTLWHYIPDRPSLLARAGDLFDWIESGKLFIYIGKVLPLEQAADAHRLLESRESVGKVLLSTIGQG